MPFMKVGRRATKSAVQVAVCRVKEGNKIILQPTHKDDEECLAEFSNDELQEFAQAFKVNAYTLLSSTFCL